MKTSDKHLLLTVGVGAALVGLAVLAGYVPALHTLYMSVSGSLLGLLGVHHSASLASDKLDEGAKLVAPVAPIADVPAISVLLTEAQVQAIMPQASKENVALHTPLIIAAAMEFEIASKPRMAMFLANCALECNQLRELTEDWTGSEAQRKYEGSKVLGNTEPGDGRRFLGRGVIQLTGRYNYTAAGEAIETDLITNPEKAAEPAIAWKTAAWYWYTHRCNALADAGNLDGTVEKINGGLTDLESREVFYNRALKALS